MLREADWLHKAKRLPVGMRVRVRHGLESRDNLIVANEANRYWAYCQRCKAGAVHTKEHVRLQGAYAPPVPREVTVPTDLVRVIGSEYEVPVGAFLASKGMMYPYLPEVLYSPSAKRVLVRDASGYYHGRDITGHSSAKWLHYGSPSIAGVPKERTVIVEDVFSMFKVLFALRDTPSVGVVATLGAGVGDSAALALKNCLGVVCFYDADKAGDDGYTQLRKRLRVSATKVSRVRPPRGMDPKDMHCSEIRELLNDFRGYK